MQLIVNELGHIVSNQARLPLDGLYTVLQTTVKQRHDDCQVRRLNSLHESGGSEAMDAVMQLGRLGHAVHQTRHKGLDVVVTCKYT